MCELVGGWSFSEMVEVHMALEALTSLSASLPSGAGTWVKWSAGSSRMCGWREDTPETRSIGEQFHSSCRVASFPVQ